MVNVEGKRRARQAILYVRTLTSYPPDGPPFRPVDGDAW